VEAFEAGSLWIRDDFSAEDLIAVRLHGGEHSPDPDEPWAIYAAFYASEREFEVAIDAAYRAESGHRATA